MQFRLLVDLLLDALTGKALTRWVVSPRASEPCAEWFLLLRPISSVPVNLRFWSDFLSCGIPFAGSIEKEAIWPAEVIPAWFKSKTTTAHRKCYFPKSQLEGSIINFPASYPNLKLRRSALPGSALIIPWRVVSPSALSNTLSKLGSLSLVMSLAYPTSWFQRCWWYSFPSSYPVLSLPNARHLWQLSLLSDRTWVPCSSIALLTIQTPRYSSLLAQKIAWNRDIGVS